MSFLFDVQMDSDESPVEWLIVKARCAGESVILALLLLLYCPIVFWQHQIIPPDARHTPVEEDILLPLSSKILT